MSNLYQAHLSAKVLSVYLSLPDLLDGGATIPCLPKALSGDPACTAEQPKRASPPVQLNSNRATIGLHTETIWSPYIVSSFANTLPCFAGIANGGPYPAADGAHVPEANGAELSGFGALGTWRKRVSRAPLTAEEALKHLLLSVDVDTLYRCLIRCDSYTPATIGSAYVVELSVHSMVNVKLQEGSVACHIKQCVREIMCRGFWHILVAEDVKRLSIAGALWRCMSWSWDSW